MHRRSHKSTVIPPLTYPCKRHPDHIGSKNDVEFWSHHEKVSLWFKTQRRSLTLKIGRFSRQSPRLYWRPRPLLRSLGLAQPVRGLLPFVTSHLRPVGSPLSDAHPTNFSRTLFPGQDYNNARLLDFQQVDNYVSNQVSILEAPRMPWHDVREVMELAVPVSLIILCRST